MGGANLFSDLERNRNLRFAKSKTLEAVSMEELTIKLGALQTENQELKKEISELKSISTQRERLHHNELMEIKKDLERLKKSTPDCSSSLPNAPGMYSRVKGLKSVKNRPQSLHEMTITHALQEQLAEPKVESCESFSGSVPPFYFTLENYAHYKKNSLKWFSPAFYSHPNGYKMCIGVDAAGSSVGEGTHVSVLVYFLRGDFDSELKWPFRGTVNIWLLNERMDGNHFTKSIEFDDEVTYVDSGKVEGHFERSAGYGDPLFLEHSQLGYDQTKDCEFVRFNRLRFLVQSIDLRY